MPNDDIDRSDEADARRFRFLLSGWGYIFEEEMVCHEPGEEDEGRRVVDRVMSAQAEILNS